MPLILLPNVLGAVPPRQWLPSLVVEAVAQLDGLVAESERAGRRYLSAFPTKRPARAIPIALMPRRWTEEEALFLLEPVLAGESWGVISDAGMPCIADPGSYLVAAARQRGVEIKGYPGPSAPLLALLLSGLPAQRFAFHGYLQRDRRPHILLLQHRAIHDQAVQLVIETPYRNDSTLQEFIAVLDATTQLVVAYDLTLPTERVMGGSVASWLGKPLPSIQDHPAIFLIAAGEVKQRHR